MRDEIKQNIINSKNYNMVCESIIDNLIEKEIPKYKKKKDVEQSVRSKLHSWVTMFYENYGKVLKDAEKLSLDQLIENLLKTHVSTKERFDFYCDFFGDIDNNIKDVRKILDLGAGFNPLAYFLYSKNKDVNYTAIDVESKGVGVLNLCFEQLNVNGKAHAGDVLQLKLDQEYDVVFMFKLLPLLEQQKKGSAINLIQLLRTKYYCISYPTRSLSGKNVGMYSKYKQDIATIIEKCKLKQVFEKEYKNEVLFVLKK